MGEVRLPRRYYLAQRLRAREALLEEGVWQAKQEAEPGTELAADFPSAAALEAAGYTTVEDLDGADVAELRRAGLTRRQAETVIAAVAPLL